MKLDKTYNTHTHTHTHTQLDMISAVELSMKLDKTYDPVEALGDMKRAIKSLQQVCMRERKRERVCMYTCIYIYIYVHVYIYIYVYVCVNET